jgi:anaerobic selenocysteine-containing dehydrogenase
MSNKLSRRTFIKGLGALGAIGALGVSGINVFSEARAEEIIGRSEVKGLCMMCKHSGCSNIAIVENGVVTDVRGNPARAANKGTLCARGKSAIFNLYNPYRVKAPMKRTNPEKGLNVDPGWVEITWDEALDTVAEKFKEIWDNDPRELICNYGFAMSELTMNGLFQERRFPAIFGTPNVSSSKGQFCAIHYGVSMVMNNMPTINADHALCDYLLNVGRSGGVNCSYASGEARGLMMNLKRGMKVVVVDPLCTVEASKGEWVPILPGRDMPFILALTHVLLYELDEYDKEFVRDRTNAPYLIGEDGYYHRNANGKCLIWDESSDSAKEWDDPTLVHTSSALTGEYEIEGMRVHPAFVHFYENYKNYTPEWAEELCTIPAAKIREIAADLVKYAQIGSTVDIEGHNFRFRPAVVMTSRGVSNHEDGASVDVAGKLLNLLIGNLYVPGGAQGTGIGERLEVNEDGMLPPGYEALVGAPFSYPPEHLDLKEFFPHRHSTNTIMMQVIAEGPEKWGITYEPKALFVAGGNPILVNGSHEMVVEAIKKIPFVVTISYHLDEISNMSDILLVSPSMLESMGFVDYFGSECSMSTGEDDYVVGQTARLYRNPVDMIYNTMEPNEMIIEICSRMGILRELNQALNNDGLIGYRPISLPVPLQDKYKLDLDTRYTYEELIDRSFKNIYGDEIGIDYLKEHSFVATYAIDKARVYPSYYNESVRYQLYLHSQKTNGDLLLSKIRQSVPDPKTLMGLSVEELQQHYLPVIRYIDNMKIHSAPGEYELYATTCRLPLSVFRLGALDHNPWVLDWNNAYNPFYNSVCLHPVVAGKNGFVEGDIITVESQAGKTSGKLHITSTVHQQGCLVGGALGRMDDALGKQTSRQACFNKLLDGHLGTISPIHGGLETCARVKVYKA